MDEAEREELVARVNRKSATVGASLPETVTVDGTALPLAEFVVETRKVPGVPPESRELLDDTKKTLRAERARRLGRLESADIDREEGETLADEIIGIDRAVNCPAHGGAGLVSVLDL